MTDQARNAADGGAFEQRTGAALRDSVESLDAHTRSRLTRARHAALAQSGTQSARWRSWAPAGAVAMGVLATLLYLRQPGLQTPPPSSGAIDDLELLADVDALELNAALDNDEGYDFYEWAAAMAGERNGS